MILGVEAGKRLQIKEIHPRGFSHEGKYEGDALGP